MQPTVTKLARPATSVLRLQARSRPGHAFICSGCLQSRQLLPLSQNRPSQQRIRPAAAVGAYLIPKSLYSTTASSTAQSTSAPTPPPSLVSSGIAQLSSRRLISVSGPDAAKYLQGVITANITKPDGTPRTEPFYAAFLTAKGRVLHDVFIYPFNASSISPNPSSPQPPTGDSFVIEVDASEATRLQQHIKRYKLRAKFDLRLLDESEFQVWHAWSDDSEALAAACQELLVQCAANEKSSSSENVNENNKIIALNQDPRAPGLGYRILLFGAAPSSSSGTKTHLFNTNNVLPLVPESAYTLHRYRLGVPEGQREILRDQALPLESNIDVMGGIDFRKGCYVGQELTIRTKHRGVVRKRILPVVVSDASAPPPPSPVTGAVGKEDGDDVSSGLELEYKPTIVSSGGGEETLSLPDTEARIGRKEKPDRRVGQWLSGLGNVGLALCRLEVMTDLQVPGETASGGYNPEKDEFVVSVGTGASGGGSGAVEGEEAAAAPVTGGPQLRVKAFVPEWLRRELGMPAH